MRNLLLGSLSIAALAWSGHALAYDAQPVNPPAATGAPADTTAMAGDLKVGLSVKDSAGDLWMAKLPESGDRWDVQAWEYLTLRLASDAGIEVPVARLHRIGPARSFLLTRRFDRRPDGGHGPDQPRQA